MNIFRNILVNVTISGSRCALKGATGSCWMLLKTPFLVYNPRRRLGTDNNLLYSLSLSCHSQLFLVTLYDDGAWQPTSNLYSGGGEGGDTRLYSILNVTPFLATNSYTAPLSWGSAQRLSCILRIKRHAGVLC